MLYDITILFMLPGLLLGLWAQMRVKSAYAKYSRVPTRAGLPANEAVRRLLRQNGAEQITVTETAGELTDHFDPRTDTLRLSQGVYHSTSVAALGIAAHEAGHALQKQQHYPFLSLRTALVPVVNIGSSLSWPIFLAGLIFSWEPLMTAGIILFAAVVLWGDLDVMFIDMPPGTGDVPLTVFQSIPVDGAIMVTTPQQLVGMIVEKAMNMAGMMNVPVLGLVENMSYAVCPDCGKHVEVFGESHVDEIAERFNVKALAKLPINHKLAAACDAGLIELFEGDWLDAAIQEILK